MDVPGTASTDLRSMDCKKFGVHDSSSSDNSSSWFSNAANARSVIILHPSASVYTPSKRVPYASEPSKI